MDLSKLFGAGRIRWLHRLAAIFGIAFFFGTLAWVMGILPSSFVPLMVFELASLVLGILYIIVAFVRGYWPLAIGIAIAMSLFFAIGWALLLSVRGTPIEGLPF